MEILPFLRGKILEITVEERLKVLLINAIGIYAEAHSDRYNSSGEFLELLYGDLGTDGEKMKELGMELSIKKIFQILKLKNIILYQFEGLYKF